MREEKIHTERTETNGRSLPSVRSFNFFSFFAADVEPFRQQEALGYGLKLTVSLSSTM